MKIIIDTSILVDIDRKNQKTIDIMKSLTKDHDVIISVITVSEILTGSYLRKDQDIAVKKAKLVMGQMFWVDVDPKIAEKASEINAYLIINGKIIEFQDVLIAATALILNCDFILTFNKEHFERIPALINRIYNPLELKEKMSEK
jgi:predicted nucleic acid-binding protein